MKYDLNSDLAHALRNFCYLLECEMATYERLISLKSSSKHEIERHQGIIRKTYLPMVYLVAAFLEAFPMTANPRIKEMFENGFDEYFRKHNRN